MTKKRKKLTIIFVTNNYKPYCGGVVSSIDSFRKELMRQGHTVKVVTLDFTGEQETDPDVIRIQCPIKFMYRDNPMSVPLQINRPLRYVFDCYQPDIVHVHHPFLLGVAATRLAKAKGIPVVFTHHSQYGMYAQHYAPVFKDFANFVTEEYVRRFCAKVDVIIAPSSSIEKQLKCQKITTPITVIPSGVDSIFILKMCPQKRKQKTIKLLTVARFRAEKNLFVLFDVLKKLTILFEFTLIGYGELEKDLKVYAYQKCGLSKQQVRFIIAPSKKRIAQAYKDADVFLFASKTETQGLVFVECMAAGIPVIAFNACGSKDIITHGENGFLVTSKKQMRDSIQRFYIDQKFYESCSKNAYNRAQNYSIKYLHHRLLKMYEFCLKKEGLPKIKPNQLQSTRHF